MKTKFNTPIKQASQDGFIIGSLLILILVISILLLTITSAGILNFQSATKENSRVNAQFAADSGLDQGIHELNLDGTWPGTGPVWDGTAWVGPIAQVELFNDTTTDVKTTFEVTISPGVDIDQKVIKSIGRTYRPANASKPDATRIFEIEVASLVASNTSIVAGVGGLVLNNSAKIIDGAVFVNGEIHMSGTSQIGTSTNPLQVFVANYVCPIPANATFPQYCGSGVNNNPIDISSPNSFIYGEVNANYQIDDTNMINVNNPSDSAIVTSSGVLKQDLPIHDRAAMKAAMPYPDPNTATGTTAAAASCTTNGGTKIWGPNEKITGNVIVSRKCTVEIRGDVWITGTLTTNNSGKIKVADSLGATRPVIMIDGINGLEMNQSSEFVQNSTGTNSQVITYWSAAACSPECVNVTGVDLANSQNNITINIVNSGGATETIFYAKWSKVIIRNSVNVGALVGQVVELEQSATIAFSSQLPGFTPRTTWIKKGYLRVYQ